MIFIFLTFSNKFWSPMICDSFNVSNLRHFSTNPGDCRSIHSGPRQLRCSSWVVKLHGFGLDGSAFQIGWKIHRFFAAFFRFLELNGYWLLFHAISDLQKLPFLQLGGITQRMQPNTTAVLHRSFEVWCAKDEQTDTIYAVKNICEATCRVKM